VGFLIAIYAIDLFTIVHVLTWMIIGCVLRGMNLPFQHALIIGLMIGLGWELLEIFIEPIWTPYGEPLVNRFITDPIADLLGTVLGWFRAASSPHAATVKPD
jgi:hypothetical protein